MLDKMVAVFVKLAVTPNAIEVIMTTLSELCGSNDVFPSLRVKKLVPEAVLPTRANPDDAGYDVVAIYDPEVTDTYVQYRTGLAIEVPKGYHTEIFPRSSISKYDLVLANSIGLIDNGYRGELIFRFKIVPRANGSILSKVYEKGDKIGQIVVRRTIDLPILEVENLSDTVRGEGGFGSSDKGKTA